MHKHLSTGIKCLPLQQIGLVVAMVAMITGVLLVPAGEHAAAGAAGPSEAAEADSASGHTADEQAAADGQAAAAEGDVEGSAADRGTAKASLQRYRKVRCTADDTKCQLPTCNERLGGTLGSPEMHLSGPLYAAPTMCFK